MTKFEIRADTEVWFLELTINDHGVESTACHELRTMRQCLPKGAPNISRNPGDYGYTKPPAEIRYSVSPRGGEEDIMADPDVVKRMSAWFEGQIGESEVVSIHTKNHEVDLVFHLPDGTTA